MADETWYSTLDEETRGFMQNKGFAKETPLEAFTTLLTSYREAEKKIGIPADRVLRIPEPEDKDGWKLVHQRLGVPATPEGYDFSTVKHSDGKDADPDFLTFMRGAASAHNIPAADAAAFASDLVKHQEAQKASADTKDAAEVAVAHDTLKQAWGANFEANKATADRAAALLGLSPDFINSAATLSSYGTVMEGLRKVGAAMGEATLQGNTAIGGQNRAMTREQAIAKKQEIITDPTWTARWFKGDKAAILEIGNLDRIIAARPQESA